MIPFNPGRLKPVARPVEPQQIVPGSNFFNYEKKGGQGNVVPAVGAYASGSPAGGLSSRLADSTDGGSPSSTFPIVASVAAVGVLLWLAYQGDML